MNFHEVKIHYLFQHPRVVSVRYSYSENTFWGNNKSLGEIIIINKLNKIYNISKKCTALLVDLQSADFNI